MSLSIGEQQAVTALVASGGRDARFEDATSGAVGLRVFDAAAAVTAQAKALAGEPLSVVEVSAAAGDRAALFAYFGGGTGGDTEEVGGATVIVLDCEASTDADRFGVQLALTAPWQALDGYHEVFGGGVIEAPSRAFPVLAVAVVLAIAGVAAYVFRDVVPNVVAKWSQDAANDARVKELLRADAEFAAMASKHAAAEKAAGKLLPVDAVTKARAEALVALSRSMGTLGQYVPAVTPDSSLFPRMSGVEWMIVAAVAVAAVSYGGGAKFRRLRAA